MIDVTVLYAPDGSVSSSIAPLEVFYAAGTRWNLCVSENPEPRFTVTTVSSLVEARESVAVNCRTYIPGRSNVTVVLVAVGSAKVAWPGPLSWVQLVARLLPSTQTSRSMTVLGLADARLRPGAAGRCRASSHVMVAVGQRHGGARRKHHTCVFRRRRWAGRTACRSLRPSRLSMTFPRSATPTDPDLGGPTVNV